jgi:hypothetical protein
MLLVSLDCPFWITPSVFSNFYSPLKVLRWTIFVLEKITFLFILVMVIYIHILIISDTVTQI